MGIQVEFNPDLCLRAYEEFEKGAREKEECVPRELIVGEEYVFLKKGMRLFWLTNDEKWLKGEMPLVITKGEGDLSRPMASIKMMLFTHFLKGDEVYTRGRYRVVEVFDINSDKINFESYKRVK